MMSMFRHGTRAHACVVRPGRRRSGGAAVVWMAWATAHAVSSVATATVVYVDATAAPGGSGASWAQSFRFLGDALTNAAAPGSGVTEVRVAQGRYVPDRSEATPDGTGDRDASFDLPSGIVLRGGYAGLSYGDPDAWDPSMFETVLDGDLLGDDGLPGGSVAENAYTIIKALGTAPGTRVEGMLMRGGAATSSDSAPPWRRRGGAIFIEVGSLVVSHSRFVRNVARTRGGAIAVNEGDLEVVDCRFEENGLAVPGILTQPTSFGGAIGHFNGSLDVSGSTFVGNRSSVGGAIWGEPMATIAVRDGCLFEGNAAEVGGALRIREAGQMLVSDALFIANTAAGGGGGAIFLFESGVPDLTRSLFLMNSAFVGGAVVTDYVNVQDCRFILNQGSALVGALSGRIVSVSNSLFSRNSAERAAGVFAEIQLVVHNSSFSGHEGSTFEVESLQFESIIANSLVSGNTGGGAIDAPSGSVPWLTVRNSIIQGGWDGPGSGVLDVDPRFRSPGTDDLRLLADSPAIDAGDNAWVPQDLLYDLDGLPRIQNGTVDMGCFEGSADPAPPAVSIPHLSPGQTFGVVLGGGVFDPWTKATLIVQNVSPHPTGATVLTVLPTGGSPGGFNLPQGRVCLDSLLLPGQMKARITVPFTLADLEGEGPAAADLAVDHPALGRWVRAVLGNVSGVHGTRFVSLNGQAPPMPFEVGNFGVAWDPVLERGYVIAIVDRTGDFAMGLPTCPGDVALMPDGSVSMFDALFVLSNMGAGYGFADVNHDGVVDVLDLTQVLSGWGSCPDD